MPESDPDWPPRLATVPTDGRSWTEHIVDHVLAMEADLASQRALPANLADLEIAARILSMVEPAHPFKYTYEAREAIARRVGAIVGDVPSKPLGKLEAQMDVGHGVYRLTQAQVEIIAGPWAKGVTEEERRARIFDRMQLLSDVLGVPVATSDGCLVVGPNGAAPPRF